MKSISHLLCKIFGHKIIGGTISPCKKGYYVAEKCSRCGETIRYDITKNKDK
jgi:hypothetical protein